MVALPGPSSVAEADDFGWNSSATACRQRQAVANGDVSAQPVDIDHEARQASHPALELERHDVPQPGVASGTALGQRCSSH